MKERRNDIDSLKGIAIIAVVLYHMGIVDSGYLGVDLFLAVNGYLVIPGIVRKISDNSFSYSSYIIGKYTRLAPVSLLGSILTLILGALYFMPDLYEIVAENTFAASIFSTNILKIVTSGNYWDVFNNYNPLMHYWYLGVIFQFYIILPIFLILVSKISNSVDTRFKIQVISLFILAIISFLLYLSSYGSDPIRFYGLHFRLFELIFGGLVAICFNEFNYKSKVLSYSSLLFLIFVVFSSVFAVENSTSLSALEGGAQEYSNMQLLLPANLSLILVVFLTCVTLQFGKTTNTAFGQSHILSIIGRSSFSIYIWHQIILGIERSFIAQASDTYGLILFFVLLFGMTYFSYIYIEKRIRPNKFVTYSCVIASILIMVVSFAIYKNAGVVKDFPELEITVSNAHNGMYGEYCDRVFQYDIDFKENEKPKCLFVGNSFARDFVNILLESSLRDSIEISYSYDFNKSLTSRLSRADYLFIHFDKKDIPAYVTQNIKKSCKIYGIGTKNFGESNSPIFAARNSDHYFDKSQNVMPKFLFENERLKKVWGDHYIDLLSYAMIDSVHVRAFTDDKKIIARDCRHLTQAGARWYAHVIDFKTIFEDISQK